MIRLVTQRPETVASRAKQSEIVDLQLTNQIPDLQYLTILALPYSNTVIRLVTQRPKTVASRAKQSEIVDLQVTNQIPDLQVCVLHIL